MANFYAPEWEENSLADKTYKQLFRASTVSPSKHILHKTKKKKLLKKRKEKPLSFKQKITIRENIQNVDTHETITASKQRRNKKCKKVDNYLQNLIDKPSLEENSEEVEERCTKIHISKRKRRTAKNYITSESSEDYSKDLDNIFQSSSTSLRPATSKNIDESKRNKFSNKSMESKLIKMKHKLLENLKQNSEMPNNKTLINSSKKCNHKQSLREKMMEKLKAAKFRFLNEQMYTSNGGEALKYFKGDPSSYRAYHEGYQQQLAKWPLNPLDIIIRNIKKMPENFVIADFGCGEAKLAKSVKQKVHSFDLVALDDCIQVCDMAHVPLADNSVDVAVFCLSLMGTNLKDYLLEANRVLKLGGILKIAEVESRFDSIDSFIKAVQKYGFLFSRKDLSHDLFYFIDFKKKSNTTNINKLQEITLKPCLYKKR